MEAWTISAQELYDEIGRGGIPQILDVRNTDEFAAHRIEGRRPVPTRNVPVYEALDEPERFAPDTLDGAVIVCGHGHGSAMLVPELAALGKETRSLVGGMQAWSRLLVPVPLDVLPGPARAWQLQRPSKGCLSYVVGVPGESCLVVDPARHVEPYLELVAAHGMRVTHVVDTHVHADHVSGGPDLAAQVGAEYHLPPEDSTAEIPFPHRPLVDGEEIPLGAGSVVRAMTMHLPGHTPGTTALLVADRLLLVGDTVFVRGLGRPDLTGQAEDLARDLFRSVHERLRPLDATTLVAPAHWSSTEEINGAGQVTTTIETVFEATLLNEEAIELFVEEIVATLPEAPGTYDTIRLVNTGQVRPSEDDLEILEVGRNQCAASTTLR
ncbi:rhodanese-like domain-containing protein [Nocardioides koreensis]|uniref:Rhodanese-like domain-containing protein n=1 Tax=Nocardioides koreensis TaxID=433651 RepID=A0ABP5L6M5_9ACTN